MLLEKCSWCWIATFSTRKSAGSLANWNPGTTKLCR
jgi:hypothetical protein